MQNSSATPAATLAITKNPIMALQGRQQREHESAVDTMAMTMAAKIAMATANATVIMLPTRPRMCGETE